MECVKCKKSASSKLPVVSCDGCSRNVCKQCANLTSSEITVIELKVKHVMKFYCQSCLRGESVELFNKIIETKDDLIESKKEIIRLLEQDLKKLREEFDNLATTPSSHQFTYAEAVNKRADHGNKSIPNVPFIVCKPKSKQDCSRTRKDIVDKLDVSELSVGINSVLNRRDGCVLIKCNSNGSTNKMRDELASKMGENYDIKETKMRKPSIVVSNIEKDFFKDDIIKAIRNQNSFLEETDELDLVLAKINRNNTSQYGIIECNGSAFKKLISAGRIYIGLQRCSVWENLKVSRCYKCYGFNHKISDCKYNGPTKCSQCPDSHYYKDCKSKKFSCINCVENNNKFKTRYDVNHSVLDKICPLYEIQIKKLRERTDYRSSNTIA